MNQDDLQDIALVQLQIRQNKTDKQVQELIQWQTYQAQGSRPEEIIDIERAKEEKRIAEEHRHVLWMKRTLRPVGMGTAAALITHLLFWKLLGFEGLSFLPWLGAAWLALGLIAAVVCSPRPLTKSLSWQLAEKQLNSNIKPS